VFFNKYGRAGAQVNAPVKNNAGAVQEVSDGDNNKYTKYKKDDKILL
jgi:hypothetical protein